MARILFLLLFVTAATAQSSGEFGLKDNGLIYSPYAVTNLKRIVDSLNFKFKDCGIARYNSAIQGKAKYIRITGRAARKALSAIKLGAQYNDVKRKFSGEYSGDLLIVWHENVNQNQETELYLEHVSLSGRGDHSIFFSGEQYDTFKNRRSGWFYIYHEKNEFAKEYLEALFVEHPLASKPLPEKYSRLVQYSECLIDTSSQVFYENASGNNLYSLPSDTTKISKFMFYIDSKLKRPVFEFPIDTAVAVIPEYRSGGETADSAAIPQFDESMFAEYDVKFSVWEKQRLRRVDSLMAGDKDFAMLFKQAVAEADKFAGSTNDEFEEYAARYISKEKALFYKRRRKVYGHCSMDTAPRDHARQIAELAAETVNWEVFLRSHLDIMNDRFERMSDGTYAWEARKTYIRELEVLDINVPDLLLGICINIEKPHDNHYFGTIYRMGRALSEATDRHALETELLTMISDKLLDDQNRVLMVYLFRNYNQYLGEDQQKSNDTRLKQTFKSLPEYLTGAEN